MMYLSSFIVFPLPESILKRRYFKIQIIRKNENFFVILIQFHYAGV